MLTGVAPSYAPAAHDAQTLLYAICYMTASWNWTFAVIGVAARYCSEPSALRRYLVDASYWTYLVHLPVVLILQAAMQDLRWHWSLKFPLILTVTLAVLFASYHFVIRFSMVNRVLNGPASATVSNYSAIANVVSSR
jgi:glucan biosynthesis protein C